MHTCLTEQNGACSCFHFLFSLFGVSVADSLSVCSSTHSIARLFIHSFVKCSLAYLLMQIDNSGCSISGNVLQKKK